MPQDSFQQGIIRQALARFPTDIGGAPGDHTITLSGQEIGQIRTVLEMFVTNPAGFTPGDSATSAPRASATKPKKPKRKKR